MALGLTGRKDGQFLTIFQKDNTPHELNQNYDRRINNALGQI
jgi:hypothetical protein